MNDFDEILLEKNEIDIDNVIHDKNMIDLNYHKLKQDLRDIKDKSIIQMLKISNYSLTKCERNTFHGFFQLIDLDLSHNLLTCLSIGVFNQLFNLQIVDLSHNLISELEDSLFKNNKKLRTINLSNNLLNEINGRAFDNVQLLRKLDFSYNKIQRLGKKTLKNQSLEELNLNHNKIIDLIEHPFWFLENLIHLDLNNNRIKYLNESIFLNTTKIENLNFSNNCIRKLEKKIFINLHNLKQVDFSNNSLLGLGTCFHNKPMLIKLNLLNNPLSKYWVRDLSISKNIRILKLTIHDWLYTLEKLENLELLSDLELHVKSDRKLTLYSFVLPYINVSTIQRLYIVIQRGDFNFCNVISKFVNLEFLHIQFLEPSDLSATFNIGFHINQMPKLTNLGLININKLIIISDNDIKYNNLTYLDLTGIDNVSYDFLQSNFVTLEYLNLSESQIGYISSDLFMTLLNLKYLIMNNTKISVIENNLFHNNNKLEVIDFRDCEILIIEENSFLHLENLKQIDIRGNTELRITQSLLNGIPKSAVVYFD